MPVFRADGGGAWVPTPGAEEIAMTSQKHLKARIRTRMSRTGERYTTARRHVAGDERSTLRIDHGHHLSGGVHPDTAAIAHAVPEVSEAMVLGVGGGLGAGYILWEFEAHDVATLVLGFRREWQYPSRWAMRALERLGVPATVHETGGAAAAAAELDAALGAGTPALTWVDRQLAGWWHLPSYLSGHDGYPVLIYATEGDRVFVDDRTLAPLSISRDTLATARARIGSYKHRLIVPVPDGAPSEATLRAAAAAGLRDQVEHLSQRSDSFSLPTWRKWSRMLTDTRNAKSWPNVFARRPGLVNALLSAFEEIEPLGTHGGHLRGLFADFLSEAASLLEDRPCGSVRRTGGRSPRTGTRWPTLPCPSMSRSSPPCVSSSRASTSPSWPKATPVARSPCARRTGSGRSARSSTATPRSSPPPSTPSSPTSLCACRRSSPPRPRRSPGSEAFGHPEDHGRADRRVRAAPAT